MDPLSWLLISVCITCETGEQCLYRTASRAPMPWRWIAPAVLIHLVAMMSWLVLLRRVPLTVALPLTGANFVTIALAGRYLFRESVGRRRWTGVLFIVAGFVLVASRSTATA